MQKYCSDLRIGILNTRAPQPHGAYIRGNTVFGSMEMLHSCIQCNIFGILNSQKSLVIKFCINLP